MRSCAFKPLWPASDETALASHASAARIYGVPVPTLPTEHVTVCKPELRRRRSGVKCHLDPAADIRELKGVRVSAPAQMFVELATLLNLVDLVVVGDNLVRNRYLTSMALVDHCSSSTRAGALAARRAAGYVRDRVDSPMESRLRMLIVLAGLPEPGVNLTIRDVNGDPIRRYDLSWPSVKVIVSTTAVTTSSARSNGKPIWNVVRRSTTTSGESWS